MRLFNSHIDKKVDQTIIDGIHIKLMYHTVDWWRVWGVDGFLIKFMDW